MGGFQLVLRHRTAASSFYVSGFTPVAFLQGCVVGGWYREAETAAVVRRRRECKH